MDKVVFLSGPNLSRYLTQVSLVQGFGDPSRVGISFGVSGFYLYIPLELEEVKALVKTLNELASLIEKEEE
jgi:hypothetical protein